MNLSGMKTSELQALHNKIAQEIKRRQDAEIIAARKKIQAIVQEVGVPLEELLAAPPRAKSGPVPVRYQHPEIAENKWTGRGHQPVWVREWIASGKNLDDLLVK